MRNTLSRRHRYNLIVDGTRHLRKPVQRANYCYRGTRAAEDELDLTRTLLERWKGVEMTRRHCLKWASCLRVGILVSPLHSTNTSLLVDVRLTTIDDDKKGRKGVVMGRAEAAQEKRYRPYCSVGACMVSLCRYHRIGIGHKTFAYMLATGWGVRIDDGIPHHLTEVAIEPILLTSRPLFVVSFMML